MPTTSTELTDALIIGAGASGGPVARRLAEAGMSPGCLGQVDRVVERGRVRRDPSEPRQGD